MQDREIQKTRGANGRLPPGFWRLIVAAVVIGNLGMLALIRFSVSDWIAVSAPTFAVGIASVIIEWRQRQIRRDENG